MQTETSRINTSKIRHRLLYISKQQTFMTLFASRYWAHLSLVELVSLVYHVLPQAVFLTQLLFRSWRTFITALFHLSNFAQNSQIRDSKHRIVLSRRLSLRQLLLLTVNAKKR